MPAPILSEEVDRNILLVREHRVMLDTDLAKLYGVPAKTLNQAVKRNAFRFPGDFMFQLTVEETTALRSQFVTLKIGRGQHRKYRPYAFTEQGVAMLSTVLHSERAIQVNISIMRAFVQLREITARTRGLPDALMIWKRNTTASFESYSRQSGN
jgi:phage regulator Rha-like protein